MNRRDQETLNDIFTKQSEDITTALNDVTVDSVARAVFIKSKLEQFLSIADTYGANTVSNTYTPRKTNGSPVPTRSQNTFIYEGSDYTISAEIDWSKEISSIKTTMKRGLITICSVKWDIYTHLLTASQSRSMSKAYVVMFIPTFFGLSGNLDMVAHGYFFNRYIMSLFDVAPGQCSETVVNNLQNRRAIIISPSTNATSDTHLSFKIGTENYIDGRTPTYDQLSFLK